MNLTHGFRTRGVALLLLALAAGCGTTAAAPATTTGAVTSAPPAASPPAATSAAPTAGSTSQTSSAPTSAGAGQCSWISPDQVKAVLGANTPTPLHAGTLVRDTINTYKRILCRMGDNPQETFSTWVTIHSSEANASTFIKDMSRVGSCKPAVVAGAAEALYCPGPSSQNLYARVGVNVNGLTWARTSGPANLDLSAQFVTLYGQVAFPTS